MSAIQICDFAFAQTSRGVESFGKVLQTTRWRVEAARKEGCLLRIQCFAGLEFCMNNSRTTESNLADSDTGAQNCRALLTHSTGVVPAKLSEIIFHVIPFHH